MKPSKGITKSSGVSIINAFCAPSDISCCL